jgi:hypothetical protein
MIPKYHLIKYFLSITILLFSTIKNRSSYVFKFPTVAGILFSPFFNINGIVSLILDVFNCPLGDNIPSGLGSYVLINPNYALQIYKLFPHLDKYS